MHILNWRYNLHFTCILKLLKRTEYVKSSRSWVYIEKRKKKSGNLNLEYSIIKKSQVEKGEGERYQWNKMIN